REVGGSTPPRPIQIIRITSKSRNGLDCCGIFFMPMRGRRAHLRPQCFLTADPIVKSRASSHHSAARAEFSCTSRIQLHEQNLMLVCGTCVLPVAPTVPGICRARLPPTPDTVPQAKQPRLRKST